MSGLSRQDAEKLSSMSANLSRTRGACQESCRLFSRNLRALILKIRLNWSSCGFLARCAGCLGSLLKLLFRAQVNRFAQLAIFLYPIASEPRGGETPLLEDNATFPRCPRGRGNRGGSRHDPREQESFAMRKTTTRRPAPTALSRELRGIGGGQGSDIDPNGHVLPAPPNGSSVPTLPIYPPH